MSPNLQETVDLATFTKEILIENFIFCAVNVVDHLEVLQVYQSDQIITHYCHTNYHK